MRNAPVPFVFENPDPPPRPGRCQSLPDSGEREIVSRAANTRSVLPLAPGNQDRRGPVVRPGRATWTRN
jgi:hypothetical protein